ncbi:hypothetical protein [Arthrobacter roseus]|nr:hypothetical protein [Arthrobacter roseus]MBM7849767.1 hypothetical protein [Arthrobacter roseus]
MKNAPSTAPASRVTRPEDKKLGIGASFMYGLQPSSWAGSLKR